MRYSPVVINNPTTHYQIVKVHSNQEIHVRLSGEFTFKDVKVRSRYLDLDKNNDGHVVTQHFCETLNNSSTCYLGDILVGEIILIVYLESKLPQKRDFLTVSQPINELIRIKPYNILEFVVFNGGSWTWEWYPDSYLNLGIEELGYRCLNTNHLRWNMQSPSDVYYAGVKDFGSDLITQHHFWFRLEDDVFDFLENPANSVPLGDLIFKNNEADSYSPIEDIKDVLAVTMTLDLNKKYQKQTERTLSLPKYSMQQNTVMPVKTRLTRSLVREIDIRELQFTSFEQGCNVVEWNIGKYEVDAKTP